MPAASSSALPPEVMSLVRIEALPGGRAEVTLRNNLGAETGVVISRDDLATWDSCRRATRNASSRRCDFVPPAGCEKFPPENLIVSPPAPPQPTPQGPTTELGRGGRLPPLAPSVAAVFSDSDDQLPPQSPDCDVQTFVGIAPVPGDQAGRLIVTLRSRFGQKQDYTIREDAALTWIELQKAVQNLTNNKVSFVAPWSPVTPTELLPRPTEAQGQGLAGAIVNDPNGLTRSEPAGRRPGYMDWLDDGSQRSSLR